MKSDLAWFLIKDKIWLAPILMPCAFIPFFAANMELRFAALIMLAYSFMAPSVFIQDSRKMRVLLSLPMAKRDIADLLFSLSVFLVPPIVLLFFMIGLFTVPHAVAGSSFVTLALIFIAGLASAAYMFLRNWKASEGHKLTRLLSKRIGPIGIIAAIIILLLTDSLNQALLVAFLFGLPIALAAWKYAPLLISIVYDGSDQNIEDSKNQGQTFFFKISSPLLNSLYTGLFYGLFVCILSIAIEYLERSLSPSSPKPRMMEDIVKNAFPILAASFVPIGMFIAPWFKNLRAMRLLPLNALQLSLYLIGIIAGMLSGFALPWLLVVGAIGDYKSLWLLFEILLISIVSSIYLSNMALQWGKAEISFRNAILSVVVIAVFFSAGVAVYVYKLYPPFVWQLLGILALFCVFVIWLRRLLSHSSAPYRNS